MKCYLAITPSLVAKALEGTRHSHVGRRRHVRHYAMAGEDGGHKQTGIIGIDDEV